jgi:hypothetical protein
MIALAQELDRQHVDYKWIIFTNDTDKIPSKNVLYFKPDNNFAKMIPIADYLVQLSDTEACSYSINEALYQNVGIIVTPLPYLEEIGVKDNVNAYIMRFDMKNIPDIVAKIKKPLEFNFKHLEDNYGKLLKKSKSKYTGRVLRITKDYYDMELKANKKKDSYVACTKERAEELVKAGVGEYE